MDSKKQSLIEKTGKIAFENERKYTGCSQAVLGAFREILGDAAVPEAVFKAGTGLSGGVAITGHVCGVVTAGVMIMGLFTGRTASTWADTGLMKNTFTFGQKLTRFFTELYGSINCRDIQTRIMGRPFDFNLREDLEAFEAAGGHDIHCPMVVKNGAEKVMELLLSEGLVSENAVTNV